MAGFVSGAETITGVARFRRDQPCRFAGPADDETNCYRAYRAAALSLER